MTRRPAAKGTGHRVLQPAGWPQPRGLAHGIVATGQMIFVAGMLGADEAGRLREGFVAQAKQALSNIVAVIAEAGASPRHIVRLTWYICDMDEYLSQRSELGVAYREVMGRHFPAMAVVEINRLAEAGARVEIEATAVL